MKNFKGRGHSVKFTAGANYSSGDGVVLGDRAGVVENDVLSGAEGLAAIEGVFEMAMDAVTISEPGTKLYWDNSAGKVTTSSSGNKAMGWSMEAAASTDTEVDVKLGAF